MKILRWLYALIILISATEGLAAVHSVTTYYGIGHDISATISYSLKIMMPSGVYNGEYQSTSVFRTGDYLQNTSWNGPPPAPTVKLKSYKQNLDRALCPGLPSSWDCGSMTFEVSVAVEIEDEFFCPWLVVVNDTVQNTPQRGGGEVSGAEWLRHALPDCFCSTF